MRIKSPLRIGDKVAVSPATAKRQHRLLTMTNPDGTPAGEDLVAAPALRNQRYGLHLF
jgi:hypothetical protein